MNQECLLFGEFLAASPGFCDECKCYIGVGVRVFYDGAWRVCIPCSGLDKPDFPLGESPHETAT